MKNKNILNKKESGQIIVLLAVSIVVVMVVAALAVDGGMIYTERRFAQNAADAASLAGGGAILNLDIYTEEFFCPPSINYLSGDNMVSKAYDAALASAYLNNISDLPFLGYYIDYSEGDTPVDGILKNDPSADSNQGVFIKCYNSPQKIDVEVKITSQISTAFAHLIYPGDLVTTNLAVTTMAPGNDGTPGMAIVTTATECDKTNEVKCGIYFSSDAAKLKITESGMWSSNCLIIDNSKTESQFDVEGDITLTCSEEEFFDESQWPGEDSSEFSWLLNKLNFDQLAYNDSGPKSPEADCDSITETTGVIRDDGTYGPGKYSAIDISNQDVELSRGLYCITGDIQVTGGSLTGDEITIYQYPDTKFSVNGGTNTLTASTNSEDPIEEERPYAPYFALLFYLDGAPVKNGDPILNGNASTIMNGMFYAPERWVTVSGNKEMGTTFGLQFIVKHFEITGQGLVNIVFNPDYVLPIPPQLYLKK